MLNYFPSVYKWQLFVLAFLHTLYTVFALSLIVLPVSLSFLMTFIFHNRLNEQVPQTGKRNNTRLVIFPGTCANQHNKAYISRGSGVIILPGPSEWTDLDLPGLILSEWLYSVLPYWLGSVAGLEPADGRVKTLEFSWIQAGWNQALNYSGGLQCLK